MLFANQKGTTLKKSEKKSLLFRLIKGSVRVFYPKTELCGMENIPDEPCIIVGNHTQLHGPITCELFLSENYLTWCAAQMMELKDVPEYAYRDFWSQKPKYQRPFFKALSFLIAPLSVIVFNNARTVPVFRDNRILRTFRESILKLTEGKSLVIFPEEDKKHNHIVYNFQEGFVDLARVYYSRTGKKISFVPLYIAPKRKEMHFGKPIVFDPETENADERRRVCDYLMEEITSIAEDLPEHTVIPYRNIPKKLYPKNKKKEETK